MKSKESLLKEWIDKEKALFEEWAKSFAYSIDKLDDDGYSSILTNMAWDGWLGCSGEAIRRQGRESEKVSLKYFSDKEDEKPSGFGAWVSCADRLPNKKLFFLAYGPGLGTHIHGPTMEICQFDGDLWVEGGTELAFEEQRFTHWIPLPEPPVSD